MIGEFESMVRLNPQRTCFTYVDETGAVDALSFRETYLFSAGIARLLRRRGVRRGAAVAVDLPNSPAFVLLLLAAAYGGFSLVALNNRLTDAEKRARVADLQRVRPGFVVMTIDEASASSLLSVVSDEISGVASHGKRGHARTSFTTRSTLAATQARTTRALGRASAKQAARRREDMARHDAVESIIHFAEHGSHVFVGDETAVIMFTSGTTGRAKAVPLTWDNLCESARVSNEVLNRHGVGIWQIALPLYHVGGLQMVVRSLLNSNQFVLYRRFDADRVLADAARKGVTHISVVDKMLQDMLDSPKAPVLSCYECILLGGGPLNAKTLDRAIAIPARVYASYGMTETASQIANCLVDKRFSGGMHLLPGYEARIMGPAANGFGRLAVRGPGLFSGYLNAQAAHTADGFFLTGDTAAIDEVGTLFVKERTGDMFISGGENVYPAEICEKLMRVPGVSDAYVFGAPDPKWGRRPVGFIERAYGGASDSGDLGNLSAFEFSRYVEQSVSPQLSRVYRPKSLFALERFPRSGIGKVDRAALRELYDQRIQVERVNLYRIRLPFSKPFATAKGTLSFRETLLVEVVDHEGRTGLGECSAFTTDWYLPETIDHDLPILREQLIPAVLSNVLLHPSQADALFAEIPGALKVPMARGAIEPALWDLYAKVVEKPLWQVIGGQLDEDGSRAVVPCGAVIPVSTAEKAIEAARQCVNDGYSRVKMKVSPGQAYRAVHAVREAFPDLTITLDANQSFTENDIDELRNLDACGIEWIEEPLDPGRVPGSAPHDIFARLDKLQRSIKTPICLDESVRNASDLNRALKHSVLGCYALKIGKFGGVEPSLQFVRMIQQRGMRVWIGGMYDTGVARRLGAAFGTLPAIRDAGDIGATSRYFDVDVTNPPYTVERGNVTLNRSCFEHGLGCELDQAALSKVLVSKEHFERR